MRRSNLLAPALFASFGLPGGAFAHDIWIVTKTGAGQTTALVRYGDPSKLETPEKGKFVSVEMISPAGRISLKRPLVAVEGTPGLQIKTFAPAPGAILSAVYDNGYYAVDPADKIESNTSKLLMPRAAESWWVPKFGKTLLGAGSYRQQAGTLLELIPLDDPFAGGGTLRVRVVYKGQPVPNIKVTYADGIAPIADDKRPTMTTGKDGVARFDIGRKGPYLLTVDYLTAATHPDLSDKDELYATLAFDTSR